MCVPGGRGEGWVRTRARETIVVESAGLKPTQVSKHRSPFLRNTEAGVRTLPALGGVPAEPGQRATGPRHSPGSA